MTDYPSQPELDDELVSAYLDGELTADEHAAVEARLAADPAAAELLHQLRAVSQAVQGLPQEVVGRDLGEPIVRRVEERSRSTGGAPPGGSAASPLSAGSANGAATQITQAIPHLTIGRTRRGWVWASLAVAAALVIMAFQSNPDPDQNLPNVAQRDERRMEVTDGDQVTQRELEIRALEPAAPAAIDLAERDATRPTEPNVDGLDARSARTRAPAAASAPPIDEVAVERPSRTFVSEDAIEPHDALSAAPISPPPVALNFEPQADMSAPLSVATDEAAPPLNAAASDAPAEAVAAAPAAAGLGGHLRDGAAGASPASSKVPQPAGDEQLVVVHVLAKREALESKTFDKLLATNGIELSANEGEVTTKSEPAVPRNRRRMQESETSPTQAHVPLQSPQATTQEDLVLVEAPPTAILSCLESLSRDEENYLGIAVDETAERELLRETATPTSNDFATTQFAIEPNKRVEELGLAKFNRGFVPQKQELSTRDKEHYYRYYDMGTQEDRYAGAGSFGAGYGQYGVRLEQAQKQLADSSTERTRDSETNLGRAVRLHSWGIELPQQVPQAIDEKLTRGESGRSDPQPTATFEKLRDLESELKSAAGPPADTLHVLFVLQPSAESAPTPPSRNKAQ